MPYQGTLSPAKPRSRLVRFCTPSLADALFVLLLLRVLQLGATGLFNDPGTGWHLRTGLELLVSGSVPITDSFSTTCGGQPWVATQWLADMVMSMLFAAGGYALLAVVTATLIAGLFRWIYRTQINSGGWPAIAAMTTILAACAAAGHFLARPLVVTSIGVPVCFWWATQYARGRCSGKTIWLLVPCAMLWTNLHPGVLGGIATVGLCGTGALLHALWTFRQDQGRATSLLRRGANLVGLALGMGLATLVNPYGFAWHEWIARLMGMQALSAWVIEWKAPVWHEPATLATVGLALLLGTSILARKRSVGGAELLVLGFWTYNGFSSGRHLPLLAMILALQLGRALAGVRIRSPRMGRIGAKIPLFSDDMRQMELQTTGGLASILVVVAILILPSFGMVSLSWGIGRSGPSATRYSKGAVAYLSDNPPSGTFFNDLNYGGTLIRDVPGLPVFSDDRFGLYGEGHVAQYRNIVLLPAEHAASFFTLHGIRTVLIASHLPLKEWLERQPDWSEEYNDDIAAVFIRLELPKDDPK